MATTRPSTGFRIAAAELAGKEAALYLPTGTLRNQIAMHAFVRPGRFVACEATAHVGGTAARPPRPRFGSRSAGSRPAGAGCCPPTRWRPRR